MPWGRRLSLIVCSTLDPPSLTPSPFIESSPSLLLTSLLLRLLGSRYFFLPFFFSGFWPVRVEQCKCKCSCSGLQVAVPRCLVRPSMHQLSHIIRPADPLNAACGCPCVPASAFPRLHLLLFYSPSPSWSHHHHFLSLFLSLSS